MHADEVDVEPAVVRRLVAEQFPQWADLPLEPVTSDGTDNLIYRLGEEMSVRLPRAGGADEQAAKECRWLPEIAPLVPLAIPVPLGFGVPGCGYPFNWSVRRWLTGETAIAERIGDPLSAATELADFLLALQRIDTTDGPPPGQHNFFRGVPLSTRDAQTRAALDKVGDVIDSEAARAEWEVALRAPAWEGSPVWVHGDLQAGNVLVEDGRLSAVIDFGGLGVGDPACDVMAAWTVLPAEGRDTFRAALQVDDATWARGRGWVLSVALIILPYYQHSNPAIFSKALSWINEILAEE
ncbi:aminoglycoside phosphotransferase family protein [Streptomyces sp. NPDC094034]|uniref:aminoglycoside phosphotransferase family protein n=1 Tax=Streptomyces sp. NPDC094034 TaxID=3155309 RepID=UPI0033284C7D